MNLIKCELASIFNSGEYLILSLDENHRAQIRLLEDLLNDEMKCCDIGKHGYQLHSNMNVAVKLSNTDRTFKRGIIKSFIQKDLYEVFLLDYGKDVILNKSKIVAYSNDTFSNVEPLSFTFILHGLLPTYLCPVNGVKKLRLSKEWTKESAGFVENMLKKAEEIYFKIILIYKKKISGDLFLRLENNKFVSLRKVLIESNYCVLSENYFLANVFSFQCGIDSKFFFGNDLQQKSHFHESEICENLIEFSNENSNTSNISLIYKKLEKQKAFLKIKKIKKLDKYSNVAEGKEPIFNVEEWPGKPIFQEVCSNIEKSSALKIDEVIQKKDSFKKFIPDTFKSEFKNSKNELELDQIFSINDPLLQLQTNNHPKFINECFKMESFCKEIDKQVNTSLLTRYSEPFVLFKNCDPVKPINKFEDLTVEASIIENLKKNGSFNNLSQLQRWTIPTVLKGENTIMISSKKTGKTVSYIISVIDFVLKNIEELSEGNGPLVVIVCSSSSVGEFIDTFFQFLLHNVSEVQKSKTKIQVVLAHGGGNEEKNWINLTNGCHVLISTPLCLARLLEMPVLTNFERLSCMVLDEVDVISQEPFKQSVRLILEKCRCGSSDRKVQKIFCGERWTPNVESLTRIYLKCIYTLIIGSYSEAAVYSKLKPAIYLMDQHHKQELLLEKIKEHIGKCKILVACENASDAISLNNYLIQKQIDSLIAHENMIFEELKGIVAKWDSCYSYPVIILTDDVLNELKVQNVDILVHYCLTEKSKSNFFFRYATFLNSEKLDPQKKVSSKNIILMDNNNYIQLPHIIDFVVRLGGKVPTRILEKSDEIRRQVEISKEKSPICKNLLTVGFCRKSKDFLCSYRHAFYLKIDSPENHPSSGWIIFSPIKMYNASTFFVKLIEHVDFTGKKSKIIYDLKALQDLQNWYSVEKNRKPHGFPNLGDICAIKSHYFNREMFHRARIIEYCEFDKYNQPTKVKVLLIDEGNFKYFKNIELYELPKQFADVLPLTIEVKLVGIQPMDFDIYWNRTANKFSEVLMLQKIHENQYWIGKIVLALRNILFLEPVLLKRFLPNLNIHVTDLLLEEKFFERGLAEKSRSYLPNLIKLCKVAGIEVPKEGITKKKLQLMKADWVFFDKDFVKVKFLGAEDTSIVFFLIEKFMDLLKDLENACQLEGEKKKSKSDNTNIEQFFSFSIGMFCLAYFENSWKRGKIESENKTSFYVFFVDHGIFQFVNKADVVPISQRLLLQLPCQAVECSLVGVKPESISSEKLLQEIYSFSNRGQISLFAQIVRKIERAEITYGYKYSINLLASNGQSFNKYLVESKLAGLIESEKKSITNIESISSSQKIVSNSQNDFQEEKRLLHSDTKQYLSSYLMSDHLFENKDGEQFLQEFANKINPIQSVKSAIVSEKCKYNFKKTVQVSLDQVENKQDLKKAKWLLGMFKDRKSEKKEELELKNRENVLTPKVLWSQNHSKIELKIFLNNIERYRCDLNDTNLLFRCYVDDNVYSVDFKFYGAVIPKFTSVRVQTFHIIINLKKQCFLLWPRLFKENEKHQWISANSESIQDDAKIDNSYMEQIQTVKRNIEAGILKDGIRMDKVYEYSGSESTDLDQDYDSFEGED